MASLASYKYPLPRAAAARSNNNLDTLESYVYVIQEAQIPLRNRASATYFFVAKLLSIAVMTCSYLYHLQSLRPMIRLIYDANGFQHATAERAHDARSHCRLMSLFQRIPASTRISFILPETRAELHDSCYIGLSLFTFTQ